MTYRGFLSRTTLGLRAPKSRSTNIDASRGGVTGHYAGKAQGVDTALSGHSKCISLWRGYQNYHMNTHGWSDIAYSLGVCQHGYIFAGRGAGVRTAANGTNAGNAYWYAVCAIIGGSEKPTQDLLDAFAEAVRLLRRDGRAASRINKHSDHKATGCPGSPLGAAIDSGAVNPTGPAPTPPPTPTPTPTPTDPEDDEMLKRGSNATDAVKAYQRRLLQWAKGRTGDPYDAARSYGADGDFGGNTEAMVKEFQKAYDLPVTGTIGGVTAGLLAMYATGGGGGGGAHKHGVVADPKLTIGGKDALGKELAKHLSVHGILHTREAG